MPVLHAGLVGTGRACSFTQVKRRLRADGFIGSLASLLMTELLALVAERKGSRLPIDAGLGGNCDIRHSL